MTRCLLVCALVLSASEVSAQSRNLEWDLTASSPAAAQAWAYAVTDNGQAVAASPVACVASASSGVATCRRPITLTPGAHTLVVTVTGNGVVLSSAPFATEDPSRPTNLRLTMTVAVRSDGTAEMLAFNVEKLPATP